MPGKTTLINRPKSPDQSSLQPAPEGGAAVNPVRPDRLYAINNFDLIRLLAALQVAFHHLIQQLKIEPSGIIFSSIFKITSLFPGVPVFFFVSGFLISKSYENSSHILSYFKNRVLRIYPALMLCVALSVISVIASGYYSTISLPIGKFIFWMFSQITIPGLYNPDFMRGYGSGVLDGPVWTLTVEMQLYILIPIVYMLVSHYKKDINKSIIVLIVIFSIINTIFSVAQDDAVFKTGVLFKLFNISFLPWFFMFLLGVFCQKNFATLYKYFHGKLFYVLGSYLLIFYSLGVWWHLNLSIINPLMQLGLAMVIFSFAYSYTNVSNKLLRHNDISYGLYLYHMPVCNYFIYLGLEHNKIYLYLAVLLASIIAYISWISLEKPALLLKKYSINPINWRYRMTNG